MKHANIITKLTLEQKCALLSGETVFTTRGYKNAGIPSITLSDGPNGVRKQAGAADHLGLNPSVPATCFPTAATVACSWDPALGEQLGRAMGEEAAAQEVSVLLGPGLNTKRSPLCGRNFEYFSEDPYLSGKLAAAYVRGIQSNGIAACPKHFAVNSQELRRMASDSVVDERTLRELYLTGFEIVVKEAHPKTIMSSYNLVNGTYANENAHLLQDILRRDWGFDGAVVTDWGGSNDHALSVKNGSTLEMPAPGGDAVRELLKAVETGKISESDVDARLDEVRKEAGDVMLHLMFYAVMGREQGAFTMEDILEGESEKLIRRHPHVYGDVSAQDSETVKQNWEKIKLREGNRSVLAGVPRSLPAMIKAQRIQEKAHGVGFDWGDTEGVWDKVQEELSELRTEVQRGDRERAAAELGDVLFSLVNYAQHLGIRADDALERTNKKFIARFTEMERAIAQDGKKLGEMTLEQMDAYWDRAKKKLG